MSCLYILEIKPWSVASFANIFSHSIGCLFILFMVSFAVQKLIRLIRSNLFTFAFISIALGDLEKHWYDLRQRMFCLCSLLGVLWCHVLYLSLSHFELIFGYAAREYSNFTDLHVAVQLSQHHLLKRLSSLHCIFLPSLSKIN